IDVDAQNGGEVIADVLTGLELVGDAGTVAGADVKEPIGTEAEAAGVVATRGPFEDDLLRSGIGLGRVAFGLEARLPASLGQALLVVVVDDVGDVHVAILGKLGMEGHRVGGLAGLAQVEERIGLVRLGVVAKGEDLAAMLDDEEAIAPGSIDDLERL